MGTVTCVFSFLIVFSLSSLLDYHLPPSQALCALSFSHKKPIPSFHPQFSLPLSHLSISFKACHRSSQRGEIGTVGHRVARSWRCGGVETMAFWSVLIFLCVGWSVLVDLMLIFLWFWVEIRWVLMEFWPACLEISFWFNGFLVSDDGGDGGYGSVRERGGEGVNNKKNCKTMNILLNKCGE